MQNKGSSHNLNYSAQEGLSDRSWVVNAICQHPKVLCLISHTQKKIYNALSVTLWMWWWGFSNAGALWSTLSLPLLPGLLWPVVVAPDRVLSMGQIELNGVLMLNWIVWKRTSTRKALTLKNYEDEYGIKTKKPNQTVLHWHYSKVHSDNLLFFFFGLVLWHVNHSWLFNAKSIFLYINSSISNNSV